MHFKETTRKMIKSVLLKSKELEEDPTVKDDCVILEDWIELTFKDKLEDLVLIGAVKLDVQFHNDFFAGWSVWWSWKSNSLYLIIQIRIMIIFVILHLL